ncbi:hypothetical protein AAFF_G00227650 [Aldrovandia affinis]|uniref:Uncharacterized protein n=1 Tax=Aldrovandia affinis TaxID=143900 RepID=A0AAD7TC43_9TELE|nr:hypothetical protein AAFF_G00227650 [Aldrovandia affinis]
MCGIALHKEDFVFSGQGRRRGTRDLSFQRGMKNGHKMNTTGPCPQSQRPTGERPAEERRRAPYTATRSGSNANTANVTTQPEPKPRPTSSRTGNKAAVGKYAPDAANNRGEREPSQLKDPTSCFGEDPSPHTARTPNSGSSVPPKLSRPSQAKMQLSDAVSQNA